MKDKSHIKIFAKHFVGAFLIVLLLGTLNILAADSVVTLDRSEREAASCATTIDPIEQSYILIEVPDAYATLLLFPGGRGKLFVADGGLSINSSNFLVRTRHLFGGYKFNVAVMDAATDYLSCPYGLMGQRLTEEYASDIDAIIQDLREQFPDKEVWVVGTSRGSISAAQSAAVLPQIFGGPDGLVLTSSVTQESSSSIPTNTVLDVELEEITVPTLIVSNIDDECYVTPPGDATLIKERLIAVPKIAIKKLRGGLFPLSTECQALTYHGFFGTEHRAVSTISKWIIKN